MSNNVPEAPTTPGAAPKKDHTAVIVVVVVVLCVVVLPIIIGTILVFAVLGFVSDHLGDMTISDFFREIEYMETDGTPLTNRESAAVRNIVSQIENKTLEKRSISFTDCRYLERIAGYYVSDGSNKFCDGENIYGTIRKVAIDDNDSEDMYRYKLILQSDNSCGYFIFDRTLSARREFKSGEKYCLEIGLDELKLVETNEELEPLKKNDDKKNDDEDVNVNINIKSRA